MSATTVTAVTPIAEGADLHQLTHALASAQESLGEQFEWRYACHADQAEEVAALAVDVGMESCGVVIDSTNIAATRNLLTAMGTGDYVLALDADDAWAPGGLAQMRWILDTRPEVVGAHGRSEDLDIPLRGGPPPWFATFPDDTAAPGMLARRREQIGAAEAGWRHQAADTFVVGYPVHVSAGLMRRGPVLAVGGWDEDLGNYAEGAALIAKLQRTYSWHVTSGTVVHLRRIHRGGLEDRVLTLTPQACRDVNHILDAHEAGKSLHAPHPPWDVPYVDRAPRPVLGPDGESIEIPQLNPDDERPPMSLVDKFVAPLTVRDPHAKSPEEYAAMERARLDTPDLDDATPDIDHDQELRKLLGLDTPQEDQ